MQNLFNPLQPSVAFLYQVLLFNTELQWVNVPYTKLFLHNNFEISIHCQVKGLVEIHYVWNDPNQENIILFQYIQYVFCYPLTENIHHKQRGLYILKL